MTMFPNNVRSNSIMDSFKINDMMSNIKNNSEKMEMLYWYLINKGLIDENEFNEFCDSHKVINKLKED
ncbi:MAG: hypothetical protein ACOCP8_02980 [archaeon]